jgi:hypothetical protein
VVGHVAQILINYLVVDVALVLKAILIIYYEFQRINLNVKKKNASIVCTHEKCV